MMSEYRVALSIGMPVYNGSKYISDALDSLLAQTFTDFQLIISDNASTDDTQAICELYSQRDSRIRYVRQVENKGALANFIFVLEQAEAPFFMWAAADDRWDKDWIQSIYPHIQNERHIAGFGELTHIDQYSLPLKHPANGAELRFSGNGLWRKLAFYLAYEGLGKANLFYAIYPREQLQRVNLKGYCYDYQILFFILEYLEFIQIKGAYFHKRIHSDSESVEGGGCANHFTFITPVKILWHDLLVATHYLQEAALGLRFLLIILIPVKILLALRFHVIKGGSALVNKLRS